MYVLGEWFRQVECFPFFRSNLLAIFFASWSNIWVKKKHHRRGSHFAACFFFKPLLSYTSHTHSSSSWTKTFTNTNFQSKPWKVSLFVTLVSHAPHATSNYFSVCISQGICLAALCWHSFPQWTPSFQKLQLVSCLFVVGNSSPRHKKKALNPGAKPRIQRSRQIFFFFVVVVLFWSYSEREEVKLFQREPALPVCAGP